MRYLDLGQTLALSLKYHTHPCLVLQVCTQISKSQNHGFVGHIRHFLGLLVDYCGVDVLGSWYKFVNVGPKAGRRVCTCAGLQANPMGVVTLL